MIDKTEVLKWMWNVENSHFAPQVEFDGRNPEVRSDMALLFIVIFTNLTDVTGLVVIVFYASAATVCPLTTHLAYVPTFIGIWIQALCNLVCLTLWFYNHFLLAFLFDFCLFFCTFYILYYAVCVLGLVCRDAVIMAVFSRLGTGLFIVLCANEVLIGFE